MKNIMHKLATLTFGLVLVFILSSFLIRQTSSDEIKDQYLTIRIFESGGQTSGEDNKILIAYADGRIETIPLSKGKGSIEENLLKINNQLNVLSKAGFDLVSANSTFTWTTTYVFKKR